MTKHYFCSMNLPAVFVDMLKGLLPTEWEALQLAIGQSEASVSVRVNPLRQVVVPQGADRVPWCPGGFYLDRREPFTFDTDFHAGRYYVQDASSMFIHHVLSALVREPVRYLDLCAAPGGKATAAMSALPMGSLVVANEVVPQRARVLCDNVMRWGNPAAVVASSTPAQWGKMRHWFDVIAADVPCSGEGMMRKEEEAVAQWSPSLVEQCATRQRTIVDDVWPALRPGGLFVYSTCTYNRQENEEIVEHLMRHYGAQPVEVPVDPSWNIHPAVESPCVAYRFMPHRTRGEGLFLAVLRKPDDEPCVPFKPKRLPSTSPVKTQQPQEWLADASAMSWTMQGDNAVAVPREHAASVDVLRSSVQVLQAGVTVATAKGKGFVPHQALALSAALARGVACCEVDYRTAMAYLRGEAIVVDAPRGYVIVTHRGAALGWANNLGNRANNLYPKGLRVLSSHIPETEPMVVG